MRMASNLTQELDSLISRENRLHLDPWVKYLEYVSDDRTLRLALQKPPNRGVGLLWARRSSAAAASDDDEDDDGVASSRKRRQEGEDKAEHYKDQMDLNNDSSVNSLIDRGDIGLINMFFPADLDTTPPFCYTEQEWLAAAVEEVNSKLPLLSKCSVMVAVMMIIKSVRAYFNTQSSVHDVLNDVAMIDRADLALFDQLVEYPAGSDLALTLLALSLTSYRRDTICTPFPFQWEKREGGQLRNYGAVMTALTQLPAIRQLTIGHHSSRNKEDGGRNEEKKHDEHGYEEGKPISYWKRTRRKLYMESPSSLAILHFLLSRQPVHLQEVWVGSLRPRQEMLSEPVAEIAVVLPPDPVFEELAKQQGSSIAYHGSNAVNLHRIVNDGLRCMSGTRLQANGAVFGDGIYLTGDVLVALGFTTRGDGRGWVSSIWTDSEGQMQYKVVLKCRVINSTEVVKPPGNNSNNVAKDTLQNAKEATKTGAGGAGAGDYFVVQDDSHVQVVSLLLFFAPKTSPSSSSSSSSSAAIASATATTSVAAVKRKSRLKSGQVARPAVPSTSSSSPSSTTATITTSSSFHAADPCAGIGYGANMSPVFAAIVIVMLVATLFAVSLRYG